MARRTQTLVVGVIVLLVLIGIGSRLRVPYVVLLPGPVSDTLGTVPRDLLEHGQSPSTPVVGIAGATTQPTSGHLLLTTVSEYPGSCSQHPTLFTAVKAWFNRTETVDPSAVICPPGVSTSSVRAQSEQQMAQSQTDATTAALLQLGYHPTSLHISVGATEDGTPAASVLQPADEILAVDGKAVTSLPVLRALVQAHPVGSTLTLSIRRNGKTRDVTTTSVKGAGSSAILGITPDRVATFSGIDVHIGIDPQSVGGPSAGTALALGIITKLTPGGLTGGRTIAGTGTVDGFGNVGPIGGIQQKIAAAVSAHASVFFAPADECPDAVAAAPKSLILIKADTLATVVKALETLKSGSTAVPRC